MKNMKITEKAQDCHPMPSSCEGPKYPYGLRICLDNESLQKLGIKELPEIGTMMKVIAVVEVVGARVDKSEHHEYKSLDLQITDMELSAKADKKNTADKLYEE